MALYRLLQEDRYEVAALLTTMTRDYDRISMHGVRRELLRRQAASLGIPLEELWITKGAGNEEYEAAVRHVLVKYQGQGVRRVAFGDLFLEDLRAYREKNLARIGMEGLFPVWGRDTQAFAREFLRLGFRATLVCVDTAKVPDAFAGRAFDHALLGEFPEGVDPCGENGEFHTFVWAGPVFREPVEFSLGEIRKDGQFCFRDLVPAAAAL